MAIAMRYGTPGESSGGAFGGSESEVEIDFGLTAQLTLRSASYTDIPITFNKTFSGVPKVFAIPVSDSVAYQFGSMQLALKYANGAPVISTTGATFRWFNNSGAQRNPYLMWMAIYIP